MSLDRFIMENQLVGGGKRRFCVVASSSVHLLDLNLLILAVRIQRIIGRGKISTSVFLSPTMVDLGFNT